MLDPSIVFIPVAGFAKLLAIRHLDWEILKDCAKI
jgi:hypothetical protein